MAYDYNQLKSDYEKMSEADKANFSNMAKSDKSWNIQKFLNQYNQEKATPVQNNTQNNNQNSNIAVSEYQWTGTDTKKQSWYTNQWEGSYTYSQTSNYYEKNQPTTPTTPETSTTKTTDYWQAIRDAWNKKSYAEQQELLKNNPNMRNELAKYWATPKEAEVKEEKTEETKTWETKWLDYQDNSPERMAEIADNVNKFAVTDPDLFTNEDSFRNFFIDWKGRTPEQEKFLMDYYKNRKMYNKLDNYTSNEIGNMMVNGEIPDSYVNYLKNSNPTRYAEVMDAKAKATDKIKDAAAMDTISSMEWDGKDTTTSKVIEWLKAQWLLLDEDWNLIDDRREHYASEEENTYLKQIADLSARNLEIDNIVKHSYDDYVEKYPWATKATLMAMAQDVNSDLLREKENNLVELTRLQGYVWYMQSERQEMNKAGADTIAQLQKDYGMYYTYTPEWMSELYQAQYAATNVTLDQADKWTDTQKQMALEAVLTPIYEQYGSIIERPMAQVINDVIAYAKNKWISLNQALQENFMTPLKNKDAYKQLSSAEPYTIKVWDVLYEYDFNTKEFTPVNTAAIWTATWLGTMRTERNNNPTAMTTDVAKSLWLVEWEDYVKWDSFKDKNWNTLYTAKFLNDPVETTIKALDNWANSSSTHAFYTAGGDQRRSHTAMSDNEWLAKTPEQKQETVLKMLQREGWDITKMTYYNQWDNAIVNEQNSKFWNLSWWNSWWYLDNFEADYEAYLKSPKDYDKSDIEARYAPLWMSWYDFTSQATNYNKTGRKEKVLWDAKSSLEAAVALYDYIWWNSSISWSDVLWAYMWALQWNLWWISNLLWWWDKQAWLLNWAASYTIPQSKQRTARWYFNSLNARQTLDKLIDTKDKWATYWSMTEWEWDLLRSASNLLDRSQSWDDFKKNLEDLIYWLQLSIVHWWWELPRNFAGSSAQNMVVNEVTKWRWDEYKNKQATTQTTQTTQWEVKRF